MSARGLPSSDPAVATAAAVDDRTGDEARVTVDDVDVAAPTDDGVATVRVTLHERPDGGETATVADVEADSVDATATRKSGDPPAPSSAGRSALASR